MEATFHMFCPNCWKKVAILLEETEKNVFRCPQCGMVVIYDRTATFDVTKPIYRFSYPDGRREGHDTITGVTTRRQMENMKFVETSPTGDIISETYFAEIQYYGFYLRFAKEAFIPCLMCQEKLQKIIDNHTIRIAETSNKITLLIQNTKDGDKMGFSLRFLRYDPVFVPCYKCQRKLQKILEKAELIIGNKDYEPMIEFFRKWRPFDGERKEHN